MKKIGYIALGAMAIGGLTMAFSTEARAQAAKTFVWLLAGNAGTNPAKDFLGTTDAQPLVVRTANAERLRVDSSGRVGIGTNAPGTLLDVNGRARVTAFTMPTGAGASKIFTSDASGNASWAVQGPAPLLLPFSGSANVASPGAVFKLSNTGSGRAIIVQNASNDFAFQSIGVSPSGGTPNNPVLFSDTGTQTYGIIGVGAIGSVGAFTVTDNSFAMFGQATTGANSVAVRAQHDPSGNSVNLGTQNYSGNFSGDVLVRNGEISKAYSNNTDDPAVPLAYGNINSNGTVSAATPNVSSVYNSGNQEYEITVSGKTVDLFNDLVVCTATTSSPVVVTTTTSGGKLIVRLWTLGSARTTGRFQFMIIQPNLTNGPRQQGDPATSDRLVPAQHKINVQEEADPKKAPSVTKSSNRP